MAKTNNYSDKLKDPRWQKCRLKIMERDGFKCRICNNDEDTLHAHHIMYRNQVEPWEYEDKELITVCEGHHKMIHSPIIDPSYFTKVINNGIIDVYDFIQACPLSLLVFQHIENHKGIWELISSRFGWFPEKIQVLSNLVLFINNVDCNIYMDHDSMNFFEYIKPTKSIFNNTK
jgi:hypothetical protein